MNEAKLKRVESGLNGIAMKVLNAVPISEAWTKQQVLAELRRNNCGAQVNVVEGCLDTLRGRGLLSEPERGTFQRVQAKPKVQLIHPTTTEEAHMAAQPQKSQPNDPLTRLAEIADSARALAKAVEEVALDVQQQIDCIHADTEKLRQLQALLKSI